MQWQLLPFGSNIFGRTQKAFKNVTSIGFVYPWSINKILNTTESYANAMNNQHPNFLWPRFVRKTRNKGKKSQRGSFEFWVDVSMSKLSGLSPWHTAWATGWQTSSPEDEWSVGHGIRFPGLNSRLCYALEALSKSWPLSRAWFLTCKWEPPAITPPSPVVQLR
jgi:hypothetical protein